MVNDYFIVGPHLVLRALVGDVDSGALELSIRGRDDVELGDASARRRGDALVLAISWRSAVAVEREIEAWQLWTRTASRAHDHARALVVDATLDDHAGAALARDGFVSDGRGWRRPAGAFVRADKTASTDAVYDQPLWVPWNFVPRDRDVLDAIRARPGQRVLDLGCGFGKNATWLEERGFEVFGIDSSPPAVARCRTLARASANFLVASAASLPFDDDSFDVLLDIGCLHSVPADERAAVVAEVARVLRPGGELLSRSFKPRGAEWLARQPFAASAFGLSADEATRLLGAAFDVSCWRPHAEMNYLRATPRRRCASQ